MPIRRTEAKPRPLEILGISETEERVYEWLLTHSGTTVSEIAQAPALTPGKTQRLLDAIEAKGLATHTPERPRRYIAAEPDIALRALALRRQEDLQSAEGAIRRLQEQAATAQSHGEQKQMVELITSREVERQIFEQIQGGAIHEVAALVKLPMLITRPEKFEDYEPQRAAQARGVHYRTINDAEFLASPGAVARIRIDMKGGEEVRVCPSLPFKMVLADRRIALIPLNPKQHDSPVLLVRSSALLDALCVLFEMLWERAAPISFSSSGALETSGSVSRLPQEIRELIQLMATGLNDKKIAGELGVSMRTLTRRIFELTKSLDARTRFQAGWIAALRLSGATAAPKSDRE